MRRSTGKRLYARFLVGFTKRYAQSPPHFRKASGISQFPAALAEQVVETAEQSGSKTIGDTIREVGRVPQREVKYLEGQPELSDV